MSEVRVDDVTQLPEVEPTRWKFWWSRQQNLNELVQDQVPEESLEQSQEELGAARPLFTDETDTWYHKLWNKVPTISTFRQFPTMEINENLHYSQLNIEQLKFLQEEAKQAVSRNTSTWCWFEESTEISTEQLDWSKRPGIISVHGTGSARYPLNIEKNPNEKESLIFKIYVKNSLILPSDSPLDYLHELPWSTKVYNSIKEHYKFPNERHLYLKKKTDGLLTGKKVLIISITGHLPEKYEKCSLGSQRSAYYLSTKLAQSLKHERPSSVYSLSFQCPLDNEAIDKCLHKCISLLKNFENLFKDVDAIFFIGVYHSVPLLISLVAHILKRNTNLEFSEEAYIGILAFESNLEGYRFWDHSTDNNVNNNDSGNQQNYTKIKQTREKQLFQGSTKKEQEILMNIRSYRKLKSMESIAVQQNLDWILYNWKPVRMTFFGKLYDNFMTISQKLAIDYLHPKIFRQIWCDGKYMGVDTKKPEELGIEDVHLKSLNFECGLKVPESRIFEIDLLNNLLLSINLGHSEYVPLTKLVSPFFISRSYNENTISPSIKKQIQNDLKPWITKMELKWKLPVTSKDDKLDLPESISSLYTFLQFSHFENWKSPELVKLYGDMYDDDDTYKCFIENTIKTKSPVYKRHLKLSGDHSTPKSILQTMNQYDLVWKLYESLSDFMLLRNIPHQEYPLPLNFSISLDYSFRRQSFSDPSAFQRCNKEALLRLTNLWVSYQTWDPPTRGLKKLKDIMSVLLLYNDPQKLIIDLERR